MSDKRPARPFVCPDRRRGPARRFAGIACVSTALALAGCSSVPDAADPTEWAEDVSDWASGEAGAAEKKEKAAKKPVEKPAGEKTAAAGEEAGPDGKADADYAGVGSVPERPRYPTEEDLDRLREGLVADRDRARHGDTAAKPPEVTRQERAAAAKADEGAQKPSGATPEAAPVDRVARAGDADAPPRTADEAVRKRRTAPEKPAAKRADSGTAGAESPAPRTRDADAPETRATADATPPAPGATATGGPPPRPGLRADERADERATDTAARETAERARAAREGGGQRAASDGGDMAVLERTYQQALSTGGSAAGTGPRQGAAQQVRRPSGRGGDGQPAVEVNMPGGARAAGGRDLTPPRAGDGGGRGHDPARAGVSYHAATLHYGHGSSALSRDDREVLEAVVEEWKKTDGTLRVIGHASSFTANMAPDEHKLVNFQTSLMRAQRVARLLRNEMGVPADAIHVGARSDNQPIFLEVMPAGQRGNRRTEIYLDY